MIRKLLKGITTRVLPFTSSGAGSALHDIAASEPKLRAYITHVLPRTVRVHCTVPDAGGPFA